MNNWIITVVSEINEKSFWQDPLGWISRGVTQGLMDFFATIGNAILDFIVPMSDVFTLYGILFLCMARVFGFTSANKYGGLIIVTWLFIQFISIGR